MSTLCVGFGLEGCRLIQAIEMDDAVNNNGSLADRMHTVCFSANPSISMPADGPFSSATSSSRSAHIEIPGNSTRTRCPYGMLSAEFLESTVSEALRKPLETMDFCSGILCCHNLCEPVASSLASSAVTNVLRDSLAPLSYVGSVITLPYWRNGVNVHGPLQHYVGCLSLSELHEASDAILCMDSERTSAEFKDANHGVYYAARALHNVMYHADLGDVVSTVCPHPSMKFLEVHGSHQVDLNAAKKLPNRSGRKPRLTSTQFELWSTCMQRLLSRVPLRDWEQVRIATCAAQIFVDGDEARTADINLRTLSPLLENTVSPVDIVRRNSSSSERTLTWIASRSSHVCTINAMVKKADAQWKRGAYRHWFSGSGASGKTLSTELGASMEYLQNVLDDQMEWFPQLQQHYAPR